MFEWYLRANVRLADLADVMTATVGQDPLGKQSEGGRWFTRGWTLQELLAPWKVEFYERDWYLVAKKGDIKDLIQNTSTVDRDSSKCLVPVKVLRLSTCCFNRSKG